jgi:hypothetical protein
MGTSGALYVVNSRKGIKANTDTSKESVQNVVRDNPHRILLDLIS